MRANRVTIPLAFLFAVAVRGNAIEPGWPIATPSGAGMDETKLAQARDYALTGEGSGCIIRHGKQVFAWGDPKQLYDLKSSSKSFGATVLGLALMDGKVKLDDPAKKFCPSFGVPPDENAQTGWLDKITLRMLATQTAGFEKPGGFGKLLFEPGTKWHYSDGGPNWLADCLTLVYRCDLTELVFERVFNPIGIGRDDLRWRNNSYRPRQLDGIPRREFGSGVSANVRAMARFGYLYLREGRWKDREILPRSFVELARRTAPDIARLPVLESVERPGHFGGVASAHYGLLWWNNNDGTLADVPRNAFWTWGLYDSLIVVIPSLDIVVARAGKSWAREKDGGHYDVLKPFLGPIVASVKAQPECGRGLSAPTATNGVSNTGRGAEAPPTFQNSPVIREIRWAPKETIIRKAKGSDNWPMTWGDDDALYTAYGDGNGFEPFTKEKLSLGLAKITGAPPDFAGVNIRSSSIEQKGDGKRGIKASGMLMVNGVLYLLARNAGNSQLAWSSDHGATWTWADWKCTESLGCPTFLNFGRNYAGARDGFVYVYSPDTDSAYERADRMVLARVPKDSLRDDDAYEFFERLDAAGQPVWTKDIAQRGAVLKHCGRCYRSGVTYNAPLHRYLWCVTMPVEDKRLAGGLTIYDAPEPWGPWTVAFTTEAWDVAPGESASFPTKWMSADGRTMHLVFSGNDSFSVRKSTLVANSTNAPAAGTAPQLRVSDNHRYLVDQQGRPFFLLADTPWFLQKLPIEDVRRVLDDRKAKGFNALFLELLDDSRIKSVDGYGAVAFEPPTDITKPAEAYWRYAEQVVEEAERRGLFVIHNSIWFGAGKGLWMHHVTPENCRVYGDFIARRFARFKNLMWMHVGDRNPDARLVACARELAAAVRRHAPHQLQTTHLQPQFASATHFNQDDWLNVNMAYTYGVAYLHVLPEYQRGNPVRPVILGETGYEGEPNSIHLLPDAKKGDLWNPYRIRRNAWWAALSGACGYCAGTRLWRWEPNWREVLNAKSSQQAPLIRWLFEPRPWWRLVPDEKHELVTAGYGTWKQPDYATAAFADDGSLAVVYVPSPRTLTVNLGKLMARVRASWFDPTSGELKTVAGGPFANRGLHEFAAPGRNSDGDGDGDWVLVLEPSR